MGSPLRTRFPTPAALRELVHCIVEVAKPERIILFGSAARGQMGPDSDLDVLVVKSGIEHRRRLAQDSDSGDPGEWLGAGRYPGVSEDASLQDHEEALKCALLGGRTLGGRDRLPRIPLIVVVADASPLIALGRIGRLELLKALFGEVLVPPAVAAEVAPRLVLPPWIRERALRQPIG